MEKIEIDEVLLGLGPLTKEETDKVLENLSECLKPSTGEQWVIKYNGQIIQGYNSREVFASLKSAKRSFTELVTYNGDFYQVINNSRDNIVSKAYGLSGGFERWRKLLAQSEKTIIKQLTDSGLVTFERIR